MGSKAGMLGCESSEDAVSFPDPRLVHTVVIQLQLSYKFNKTKERQEDLECWVPLSIMPAHKTTPNKQGPQLSSKPPHFWVYPSYLDAICAVAGRILSSLVSTGNPLAKLVLC